MTDGDSRQRKYEQTPKKSTAPILPCGPVPHCQSAQVRAGAGSLGRVPRCCISPKEDPPFTKSALILQKMQRVKATRHPVQGT